MSERNKFENVSDARPKIRENYGEDPYKAERIEDLRRAGHKTKMLAHWIFRLLLIFAVIILLAVFFVILPISEMTLSAYSRLLSFQRWSIAFLSTAGTAGVALLTVIIADLMKKAFDFAKKHLYPPDD